jgi:stress response protein YsnF
MEQSSVHWEPGDDEQLLPGNQTQAFEDILTIPVLKEQLEIHKEVRPTRVVRIQKSVHSENASVLEDLAVEAVDIERIRMDMFVDAPPSVRIEGEVTVIPVLEEVAVVTKRLRLVEEIRITKRRSSVPYEETIPLRTETVAVERIAHANTGSEV